jgi:hypothetical protein
LITGSAHGVLFVLAARLLMSQVPENIDMRIKKSEISIISDCNIISSCYDYEAAFACFIAYL